MFTKSNLSGETFAGDIYSVRSEGEFLVNNFVIECKTGYIKHKPTFWKYSKISEWFKKAYLEGQINNQFIIFLICQFKNQQSLLITNYLIDTTELLFNVAVPVIIDENIYYTYIYFFNEVLNNNFYNLFNFNQITKKFCQ